MESLFRPFSMTLTPGQVREQPVEGKFLTIITNTTGTDVEVSINNDKFEPLAKMVSIDINPMKIGRFTSLKFRNPNAPGEASMTIKFYVTVGLLHLQATMSLQSANAIYNTIATLVAGVKTNIAARGTRIEIVIQNLGTANDFVFVGTSAIDAVDKGVKLRAEDVLVLHTQTALGLFSGTTPKVSYLELCSE